MEVEKNIFNEIDNVSNQKSNLAFDDLDRVSPIRTYYKNPNDSELLSGPENAEINTDKNKELQLSDLTDYTTPNLENVSKTPLQKEEFEELRGQEQPTLDRLGNAGARLGLGAVSYLTQTIGQLAGVIPAIATQNASDIYDNFLVKAGENLNEQAKKDFPLYETNDAKNATWLENLYGKGRAQWWLDEGLGRVALVAGMFAPGAIIGEGLGIARGVGEGIEALGIGEEAFGAEGISNAFDFTKNYTATAAGKSISGISPKAIKFVQGLKGTEQVLAGTIPQMAITAKPTEDAVRNFLTNRNKQIENGEIESLDKEGNNLYLSEDEINDKALKASNNAFWQAGLTALPTAAIFAKQMYGSFGGVKNLLKKSVDNLGNALPIVTKTLGEKIGVGLLKAIGTGAENSINETSQVAIGQAAEDWGEGKRSTDNYSDVLDAYIKGFSNDDNPNFKNNALLGFVQGFLESGGSALAKAHRIATGKEKSEVAQIKDLQNLINASKLKYNNDLTDFYKKDNQTNKPILDEQGKPILDEHKVINTILGQLGQLENNDDKTIGALTDDKLIAHWADHSAISGFAYTFLGKPGGFEFINNYLEAQSKLEKNDPNRINDIDSNGNEITPERKTLELKEKLQELKKIYNNVQSISLSFLDSKSTEEEKLQAINHIDDVRRTLYDIQSSKLFIKQLQDENHIEHNSILNSSSKDLSTSLDRIEKLIKQNENLDKLNKYYTNAYNKLITKDSLNKTFKEQLKVIKTIKDKIEKAKVKTALTSSKITPTDEFKTMDLGSFEGTPETKEYKDLQANAFENTPNEKIGGGESPLEFIKRVINPFAKYLKESNNNTLITTHSSVLKAFKVWNEMGRPDVNNLSPEQLKEFGKKYNETETNTGDIEKFKSDKGELIVARHGETEDNLAGNLRSANTKLTSKGIEQAKTVGKQLENTEIPQVISSSLPRALHTSQLILDEQKKTSSQVNTKQDKINQFIQMVKDNKPFTNLDDIEFYEQNQEEIDNGAKLTPEDNTSVVNEEDVQTNATTTDNTPIISNGKKALTAFKSNNGLDDGSRPVANRWYNWLRNNKLTEGVKFLIVTKQTNKALYDELLDERKDEKDSNGLNPRQFEAKHQKDNKEEYPGTYLVIVDKEGIPIKSEGGYLQTTLTKNTENVITTPEELSNLEKFRKTIQGLKEGVKTFLPILGKSKGHAEFLQKINDKRQSINVEDSFRPINKIEIHLPTVAITTTPGFGLIKGQRVQIGKVYIFGESGNLYDLVPRNVNEQEANKIIELLLQGNTKEVEKLIFFGIPKKGIGQFTIGIKDGNLIFGKDSATLESLKTQEAQQAVKEFLLKKYVNLNKSYGFNDEFTDIFGNKHNSYKEYLLGKDTQLFGTDLVPRGQIQLRNQYLTFDPVVQQEKVKLATTPEEFFANSQFATDYSTQEEFDESTPIEKPVEVRPVILTTDKKADIERRRQEELDEFESYKPEENSLLIKQRPNFINYYEGLKQGTTDKFQAKQVRNKINAKYDAELAALEQPKEETKDDLNIDFSKGEASTEDTPKIEFDKKLNSVKEGKNTPLTQEEVNDVKRMLPNVPLNLIRGLIDNNALGRMIANSRILLSEFATTGTLYHEAWHWIEEVILTPQEKERLHQEVKDRIGNQNLTSDQIKEELADDFANYKENGQVLRQAPKRNTIFRRLLSILKDFLGLKAQDVQTVYERLNKGFYSKSIPSNPNSKIELNKAFDGKTELFTKEILDGLDKEFFDVLFANGGTPDVIFRGTNKRKIIDSLFTQATKEKGVSGNLLSKQNTLREKYLKKETTEEENKQLASYNYILSNWANVVNKWNERLTSLGFIEKIKEISEGETLQTEELGEKGRQGEAFQEANQTSTMSTMSKSSKLLIRSLSAFNKDGSVKKNSAGLEQLVEFGHTYNYLLRELSGVGNNYEDIYAKIETLIPSHPEFRILLDRLGEPNGNNSFDKQWMIQQFSQDFTKNQLFSYITIMNSNGEHYLINANTQAISERVKDRWKSQLQILGKQDSKTGKLIINPESLPKIGKFEDNIRFLEAIGIKYSSEAIPAIKDNDEFEKSVHVLYNKIISDKGDVTELYNSKYSEAGNVNKLVELESSNNNDIPELSVINATGKSVYSMGLDSFLSTVKNVINNCKTKQELLDKLPHLNSVTVQNSIYLNRLFDLNGNRRADVQFELDLNSGLNSESNDSFNKFKKDTRQLTAGEKFLQDITNVLLTGKSTFLRPSDKSTDLLTGISNWGKGQKLIVPIESVKESFDTPRIREIFKGYFTDEINRIAAFILNGQGTDVANYQNNGDKFSTFKDFSFDKNVVYDSINSLKELSQEEQSDKLKELINNEFDQFFEGVVKYFEKENTHLTNKLTELQVPFAKNLTSKYTNEQLIRAASINDYINTIEQSKVFFGDSAFYKDLFKRTGGAIGQKQSLSTGNVINEWLNTNNKRVDGKLSDDNINVLVFDDVKVKSDYYTEYTKALVDSGLTQEEAESLLEPFTKMEEGDAQGWITLSEYREFALRLGDINFWSKKHEEAFDKSIKGEQLSPEELVLFKVLKAQYFGPQNYKNNELFVPAYHKFSLMPLFPQLTKGKNLNTLYEHMTNTQTGYALFGSGSKVGTIVNSDGKANRFYTNTSNGEINTHTPLTQSVNYKFLGLQVKTSEAHDKVIFGTQFRKLIMSNLYNKGKAVEWASPLFEEYNKIISDIVDKELKSLVKELGLNPNTYTAQNVKDLVKLLKDESKSRTLPDNVVDQIQELQGQLKYKFDASVVKSKIDNMLMSLVNSRVVRQYMNGDSLVQGASSGFEQLGIRKVGTNPAFKFYSEGEGKTNSAECGIPMSKNYYTLFAKYDNNLDKLNEAIRNGEIDEKLLTLIGYRIPTQGLNSMDFFKIKEFLPESSGAMILPTEIVAKSGGDYDIDKMNIFRPYLTEEGEYATNDNNRLIEISHEILSHPDNFTSLITPNSTHILTDVVDDMRYLEYVNKKKDRGENPVSKEEFIKLFKQNLKNVKYSDQFKLTYKIEQFQKFMLAKDMIGVAAIANTSHTIAQIYNWSINRTYGKKKNKYVDIKFPHNQNEDGTISISDVMDSDNTHKISEVISQIINATVDAAKDPFLFDLNMNMDTLGVYVYLLKTGVRFENIAYMMKQPIISEYLQQLSINKSGYLSAFNKAKKPLVIQQELFKKYRELINDKKLTSRKFVDYKDLRNNLLTENQKSQEFYKDQVQILEDFLKYKEQATLLLNAVSAINHDTSGLGENLGAAELKEEQVQSAFDDKFVNGVQETLHKSFIGKMNLHKTVQDMYGQFYYLQSPEFKEAIADVFKSINPFKSDDKVTLRNLIENDLINFIVQNWGFINKEGVSKITELRTKLFKGDNSIAKQLLTIKTDKNPSEDNKKIQDNLIVKELFPLINSLKKATVENQQDNIKLFTRRLDTFTSNQLTESFRELEQLNPSLAKDIYRLGVLQSGLNNSAITYLGLIPYEYYNELVKNAFANFDKKNGASELFKFKQLFYRNNANNSLIYDFENPIGNKLGENQFGKDYDISKYTSKEIEIQKQKEEDEKVDNFFDGATLTNPIIQKDDDDKQYKKSNNPIIQKIESSKQFSKKDGVYWIKQHANMNIVNSTIREIKEQYPGMIERKQSSYFGSGGRVLEYLSIKKDSQLELDLQKNKSQSEDVQVAENIANQILETFKNKLSGAVDYSIVSDEEYKQLHPNWKEGDPIDAFYHNGIAIIPRSQLTVDTLFHEAIGHPVLDALEKHNSKLFEKITDDLLSTTKGKEIEQEVRKLYPELINSDGKLSNKAKKEIVVRALTEVAKKNINPETGKPFLSAIKRLFLALKQMFRSMFGKDINVSDLNENTTLQELADMLTIGKGKVNLEVNDLNSNEIQFKKEEQPKQLSKQLSKQEQFLYRRISTLIKLISQETNEKRKLKQQEELYFQQNKLNQLQTPGVDKDSVFYDLGKHSLEVAEKFISSLETNEDFNTEENVNYINDVLDVWREYPELESDTARLGRRMNAINDKELVKNVNDNLTNTVKPTLEEIKGQDEDIRTFKAFTGSLIDSSNYIVAAIGTIINKAQAILETRKNKLFRETKELIEKLEKSSGKSIQSIYDEIIHHNTKNDTYTIEMVKGAVSKEAEEFYYWYTEKMKGLIDKMPILLKNNILGEKEVVHLSTNFIPNVKKTSWKDIFKALDPRKEIKVNNTTKNEEQKSDAIPIDFINRINGSEKSLDLGHSIFEFAKSVDNYDQMSKVLPKVRILQRQIENTEYKQASNPSITKTGQQSNIWKMVDGFINAQVKGEYKKEQGKYQYGEYINEKGEKVAKVIDVTSMIDNSIRWNSLLRIGAAPIAAGANIAWGKMSNLIESWAGGYGKELRQAESIFWKQNFDKNSVLNKELLLNLNILQELNDYHYSESLKTGEFKTVSGEKLMEYMFSLQKGGEKYIQSSMLLAIMIKDGYMNSKGELTDKYNKATDEEKQRLAGKVQRTNHILHGRYTPKEAGIAQQQVIFRAITQFRKWIFSGVESRFDKKHYDQRLQKDIEGRWVTFTHMITNLKDSIERIKSGKLEEYEKYNMKKNLVEAIVAISAVVGIALAHSGSDDDKKKRRKNAAFKTTMLVLNRVSGDASFFFSPEQINNLGKNAIPVTKLYSDLIDLALYSDGYIGGEITRAFSKDNAFKSGNSKGMKRLTKKLLDVTPGNKLGMDAYQIFNKYALDPMNR